MSAGGTDAAYVIGAGRMGKGGGAQPETEVAVYVRVSELAGR